MRPEQDYQRAQAETQLANQGLTPGSQAYNRAMQQLGDQQSRERFNALQMGGEEQQRMQSMLLGQQQQAFGQDVAAMQAYNQALNQQFGQELQANQQNWGQMQQMADYQNRMRQQAIAEQQLQRQMPLNEMTALMQGQQVQSPAMPQFATASSGQAPNYLGAAQMSYQGGLDAFNAQQQQSQGMMSGLFGLGSAAIMM
jgi:hypothetical protein